MTVNFYFRIALQFPAVSRHGIGGIACITKGFIRTNHGQRTCVNHAIGAHNHAPGAQKVQIATNFIITHSVHSTTNADLVFDSIHQSVESSIIPLFLEI